MPVNTAVIRRGRHRPVPAPIMALISSGVGCRCRPSACLSGVRPLALLASPAGSALLPDSITGGQAALLSVREERAEASEHLSDHRRDRPSSRSFPRTRTAGNGHLRKQRVADDWIYVQLEALALVDCGSLEPMILAGLESRAPAALTVTLSLSATCTPSRISTLAVAANACGLSLANVFSRAYPSRRRSRPSRRFSRSPCLLSRRACGST